MTVLPHTIDSRRHPLERGVAPPWASGWGQDRYGVFAELRVENQVQTFRWCPPGQFLMGSPKGEEGRYKHEGPQKPVTFTQGFWMLETPVTQALYTVVMDENPSRFVSPTRPVEQVSHKDAQIFVAQLNNLIPDFNAHLPHEDQWEYACRAGTPDATWAGPMKIIGERNAPILNDIAWYAGNSGTAFDLDQGQDSSVWPEKAFDHHKTGTLPVKLKQPNSWGFFDMLGNVWEWCADTWQAPQKETDDERPPRREDSELVSHVVRGGSWGTTARNCRSAARIGFKSDRINGNLGFRLAHDGSPPRTPAS